MGAGFGTPAWPLVPWWTCTMHRMAPCTCRTCWSVQRCTCSAAIGTAPKCTAPPSTCSRCPGCATWVTSSCACGAYCCHSHDAVLDLLGVTGSEGDEGALHLASCGAQWGCAVARLAPQLPLALPSQHYSAYDGAQAWGLPPLGPPSFVLPVLGSLFCGHSGSELLAECLLLPCQPGSRLRGLEYFMLYLCHVGKKKNNLFW